MLSRDEPEGMLQDQRLVDEDRTRTLGILT
jgi:hypothetical protein